MRRLKENEIVNKKNKNLNIFVEEDNKEKKIKNDNKNNNIKKEKEILDNISLKKEIDKDYDSSLSEINEKLNKITEKKNNIDYNLTNLKNLFNNNKEENKKFTLRAIFIICFVILLAMIIYIIELKYENNIIKEKQKNEKNGKIKINEYNENKNTKLYLSL